MFFITNTTGNILIQTNSKETLFKILNKRTIPKSIYIHTKEKNIVYFIDVIDQNTIKVLEKVLDFDFDSNEHIDIIHVNDFILLKIEDKVKIIIDDYFMNNESKNMNKYLHDIISINCILPTIYAGDIEKFIKTENKLIKRESHYNKRKSYIFYTSNDIDVIDGIINLNYKFRLYIEEFIFDHYVYMNGLIFTKNIFEQTIKENKNELLHLSKCTRKIKEYFNQNDIIKTFNVFSLVLFSTIIPLKYTVGIIDNKDKFIEIVNYTKINSL